MPEPPGSPFPRHRSLLIGCFVALVLTLVLSLSLLYSQKVLTEIARLQSAQSDNVQWTLTQVEVEHLFLINALEHRMADGRADLPRIRERYDVFYSRLGTLRTAPLFHDLLATEPAFRQALGELLDFLQDTVPLLDGPDEDLRTGLPALLAKATEERQNVRMLSVTGLGHFAVRADHQRQQIAATLRQLAIATVSLMALLMALSLYLLLINRQKTRRGFALEQANQRMNTILSTSLDGVVVADAQGRIMEFNGAAEQIFRCRSAEAKGRRVTDLFVPDHLRAAHDASLARLRDGGERLIVGRGRVKMEAKRHDGEVFPIELAVQSAWDGKTEILIAFVRDISGRVAGERELVEARDRALAGEKAKADFLTVMSHEIRTPLNGLLGNLSLLGGSPLSDEQRQYVRNMDISGRILLKHVDSVLDIARFEAGQLRLAQERVHLDELLQNLVDGQGGQAAARRNRLGWAWVGAPLYWVLSDAQRIHQILLNLVGNAIKFTEDGRIRVEAEADPAPLPDDPDRRIVEFRVSDTGIGIPEKEVVTIFDDFHTSDTSFGRAAGGAGLGLGISRRITEAMGGEIGVESIPGEGSTFWVRLPLCPTDAPKPEDPAPGRRLIRARLDILVVEDNDINLQVTRAMLRREGHKVTCARDGRSGVDTAAERRFDAIFMDISMPVLDGLEATRLIRAGGGPSADTPIIALSANVLPQDTERFRDAGMDDFLGKPLTLDALRRALHAMRSEETEDGDLDEPPAPPEAEPSDTQPPQAASPTPPALPAPEGRGDRAPEEASADAGAAVVDAGKMQEMRQNLGDAGFERLLARFIEEADQLSADLPADASGIQDPDEFAGRIHKVAGSAAVFGATEFRQILNRAERAAQAGDDDDLARSLARLGPCWRQTRRYLTA